MQNYIVKAMYHRQRLQCYIIYCQNTHQTINYDYRTLFCMYIFDHDHLPKMSTGRINEVIKDFQEVQYMVQLANQGVGMCEHTHS